MPVIEVSELWVKYKEEKEHVLKGLDLQVERGEFIVVMGPSGCGKTTLSYCIAGIIPHTIRCEVSGRLRVLGHDLFKSSPTLLAGRVGLIFQNPEMQLITTSVYEEIAFPLENIGLPEEEIDYRIREVLTITGLTGLEERSPSSLSGGQKQALALATMLALRPEILVLDEPTSQLDPAGTKKITDLIVQLRKNFGITIFAVEHRVEWAAEHADRIVVMDQGKIILDGTPSEVFAHKIEAEKIGFRPPQVAEIAYRLIDRGLELRTVPVTTDEAVNVLGNLMRARS